MVKVHENGKIYKVQLREYWANVRSEKRLRNIVEMSIRNWEKGTPEYGNALRKKSFFEVCSILGIITNKWEIK